MNWMIFYALFIVFFEVAHPFPTGTPPSFNSPLDDQVVSNVDDGGTQIGFALTCDVSGDPAPDITWYRGGQQLSGQTGKTLTINPPISDVDASINGVEYFCIASSSTFGTIRSRTATVRRSSFPTAQWETAGSTEIQARLGFSVVIPCNPPSTAVPTPTVVWESRLTTPGDDTYAAIRTAPLTNVDPSMRFQLTPEGDLIIHKLVSADFDRTYRCSVTNANVHSTVASGKTHTLNAAATLPPSPDDDDSSNGIHIFYRRERVMADRGKPFVVINVVVPADANEVDSVTYNPLNGLTPGSQFQGLYQISNIQSGGVARAIYSDQMGINLNTIGILNTTVELFDPAEVTGTSGSHRVLTGRMVTLSCTVSAIPAANVRWYKDNKMLSSGASTTYEISNAQSSDSGMYQCFVSNVHGDGEGSISVQVRDSELTISTPLSGETAFVKGDNVTLTVAVKSDDPPKMTWIVRGVELTTSDNNGTYVVGDMVKGATDDRGLTEYNTTLNVLSINTTYEGEYCVEASTEMDGLMVMTNGNVLQERLLTSVSVEYVDSPCLLLGANVTLRCNQNGVPRATVQWTKGSVQVTNGGRFLISEGDELTLSVFNVEESDNGEYICTGNNTLRSGTKAEGVSGSLIASQVCVPPKITNTGGNMSLLANIGETVTLTCTVSGVPRPVITWLRGDSPIIPSDRIRIHTETNITHITSQLEVSNFMESDGGIYTCSAANKADTVTFIYKIKYKINTSVVIGIVLGVVVVILLIMIAVLVTIVLFWRCRSMRTPSPHAKSEEVYEEITVTANHHSEISTVHPESGTAHQQGVTDTELTDNIELTNNPAYGHISTIQEGTQGEQHDYTYVL